MRVSILWFRRDLRLWDNQALEEALQGESSILPVYIIDEPETGAASRWWLHHSLAALRNSLRQHQGDLLILAGDPQSIIPELCSSTHASKVVCSARYEPFAKAQEEALEKALPASVEFVVVSNYLLNEPDAIRTGSGSAYKVFTPYYNAAKSRQAPDPPDDKPSPISCIELPVQSDENALNGLLPSLDWAGKFPQTWTPGEQGARDRLTALPEIAPDYGTDRDRPDVEGTSRLSPHLHFGEVSVRTVWHALKPVEQSEPLTRQLYWRDFSYQLLAKFPDMESKPLREEFENFPWREDIGSLKRWQQGRTGYPIVDAGMRQLWETGWMHNRVRMITASFLVKHLLLHWRHGAEWFMDTLVDADAANNSAGWQWVAGCGTDAAPYFRIFNPIIQGKKFDPIGDYVRRWVPEVSRLPKKYIHEPWTAPLDVQKAAGVLLGEDYPQPIVDHPEARQRALDAYSASRN